MMSDVIIGLSLRKVNIKIPLFWLNFVIKTIKQWFKRNVVIAYTVKPVLGGHSKRRPNIVFKTHYRLMQVKTIAECSNGSILQYFWSSLRYILPLRPLFYLFFEWPLKTGFYCMLLWSKHSISKSMSIICHPAHTLWFIIGSVLKHCAITKIP